MCCFKAPILGDSLSLFVICLASEYQRSSRIVLMMMPFGAYAAHTIPASVDSKPSVTSASSSICNALVASSSVRRYAWSQVVLLKRKQRMVLSAPVLAWGKSAKWTTRAPLLGVGAKPQLLSRGGYQTALHLTLPNLESYSKIFLVSSGIMYLRQSIPVVSVGTIWSFLC